MHLLLPIAWALDLLLGDPARLPHPIVLMGKWISQGERRLNKGKHRKAKGAAFALTSILLTYAIGSLLCTDCSSNTIIHYALLALQVIMIFFCLAGHTLRKEVRMVFEAVDESLEKGRRQVARIVGRDTQQLSAQEVRTAALETLAENLSDGVIAPLFWYALLGLPGMLAYKMVNTLDSMIGYQNKRYRDFGCWAAHIDDIANYLPARLTALLMLLANQISKIIRKTDSEAAGGLLSFVIRNARNHASPNSGWPEAALAGILNCQFGGTHNYFGQAFYKPHIGTNPRPLTTSDMRRSLRICFTAEVLAVVLALILVKLS